MSGPRGTSGAAAAGLNACLASALDYAGLFPPAALEMPEALANYRRYAAARERWALGRFVVPVGRLEEMEQSAPTPAALPATIAVVGTDDAEGDARAIAAYNARHPGKSLVDVVEARTGGTEATARRAAASAGLTCYCEIAPGHPVLGRLLEAAAAAGCRAKLRTGGVELGAIPAPELVLNFIARCARLRLPFKCTAGLHHALRGRYPLTYAADAPTAVMHGYLNIMLATHALLANADLDAARALLHAETPGALGLERWGPEQIAQTRDIFVAFGTCSFEEPLECLPTF
ncbi:MAG: hypothetical protein ACRD1A_00440 [Terriglobales bacterium]